MTKSRGFTIDKYFRSVMDHKIGLINSIDNIQKTTINGWRSLHLNQVFKFGYGSQALNENIDYEIGSESGDPRVGP